MQHKIITIISSKIQNLVVTSIWKKGVFSVEWQKEVTSREKVSAAPAD